MDGSVVEEKSSFKTLGLTFSSKLDWGSYIISSAKTPSKIIRALNRYINFFSAEVALYLYKFDITNIIIILSICNILYKSIRIVRQATKANIQDCWSFPCCFT